MRFTPIFTILVCCLTSHLQAEIVALGSPPSSAYGLSDDGSVVVGDSRGGAFRWTSNGGMMQLGEPAGNSHATAVSGDGSVVVGWFLDTNGIEAFRWTHRRGMMDLGDPAAVFHSQATAVSGDGSVVVGWSNDNSSSKAFRWTSRGGMVRLIDLAGGSFHTGANGVSNDGSVVVGWNNSGSFRWTSRGGTVRLGDLAGGRSFAHGVSNDGSVVVGYSGSYAVGFEAFRWTSTEGMVGLGDLPGRSFHSEAIDASGDGSVVVGWGSNSPGSTNEFEAFRWTSETGMQSIYSGLLAQGDDLSHWQSIISANAVSAAGKTIVGFGRNANGWDEAFLARIGKQPLPVSYEVLLGNYGSGGTVELSQFDERDLVLIRNELDPQPIIEMSVKGLSPIANPVTLKFAIESGVSSTPPVTREISLFDFDADAWEIVDVRESSRFGDALTVVSGTGDVSRFVQPATGCVEAKVRYIAQTKRARFSANIDMIRWTLGEN